MDIFHLDSFSIQEKVENKEFTFLEYTQLLINHINRVNQYINALVEDRFESALIEAQKCDFQLKKGTRKGKLFGIPVTIKESLDVEGMQTTGGLISRKDNIAKKDSESVKLLKNEGAIILGKTNTPALCLSHRTANKLYGTTNNPWDLNRTPGGSSGGEGALVAVGGTTLGLGSDLGGSIRLPAHFNGVVGFKSGENQVYETGHFPNYSDELQSKMFGIGALSKSVRDAELINKIISHKVPIKKDINNFDISVPVFISGHPTSIETADTMYEIKSFLDSKYNIVDELPPHFDEYAKQWENVSTIFGLEKMNDYFNDYSSAQFLYLYIKEKLFKNTDYDEFILWTMLGLSVMRPLEGYQRVKRRVESLKSEVTEYLKGKLLVFPVYATTAPLHGELYNKIFTLRGYWDNNLDRYFAYVSMANIFGLPSLTVPVAYGIRNLPIGVQIVGNVGNEYAIFRLGEILEDRFNGYKRCTKYD